MRRHPEPYSKQKLMRFLKLLYLLIPAGLFFALIQGYARDHSTLWCTLCSVLFISYAASFLFAKRVLYLRMSLISAALLIEGITACTGLGWLHMAFIPFAVFIVLFFDPISALIGLIAIPLLEAKDIIDAGGKNNYEDIFLLFFVAVSVLTILIYRKIRDKELSVTKARHFTYHYGADMDWSSLEAERDNEIRDIMRTIMFTVMPDTASLFFVDNAELKLRCSTDESVITEGTGLIHDALGEGRTLSQKSRNKKDSGPGYAKNGKIESVIATPIREGRFTLGILAADSRNKKAFTDPDIRALELFASQIAGILTRLRVHAEMERSHQGLKVLQTEGSKLITTLDVKSVIEMTIEGVKSIFPLDAAFFITDENGYKLMRAEGIEAEENKHYDLCDTLAEMAIMEKHSIYISNMAGYTMPVLPIKKQDIASAFLLPIIYEDEPLGIAVFTSKTHDALSAHQLDLIRVLGNQAAISLKNAILHSEIKHKAVTDQLTGLYNRRHFNEIMDVELRRRARSNGPLSLLMIDIDFFKKINDTYGHPAGDAVLKSTSAIIKSTIREIDTAARYGGEEFAVILVDTDSSGALQTAERLRSNLAQMLVQAEGHDIRITASIGLASTPMDSLNKDDLIERADKALYNAKHTGRNRVIAWTTMQDKELIGGKGMLQ